jgi:uncharacterized protein (TIGR00297 family)
MALVLAGSIVLLAWRAGSLRPDGAFAALVTGAVTMHRAYAWGVLLVAWFALASVLSRIGRQRKAARTDDIIAKGARRDAVQVVANGGLFALGAMCSFTGGDSWRMAWSIVAVGALTAAGADTWGTEIGTLWGGAPWSLRDRTRVPPGTSGAVTLAGSLAVVAGAAILALLSSLLGIVAPSAVLPIATAGIVGAWSDTMIGAWLQERRWCPHCQRATERTVHDCGTATVRRGGWHRLDNDLVNASCTLIGGLTALLLTRRFG